MASHDTSNNDGALQAARRRRIDDVRNLQKQRRRQRSVEVEPHQQPQQPALSSSHQQRQNQTQPQQYEMLSEEEIYNMHHHSQHTSPSRSHVSHDASSSTHSHSRSTRRALSAKRQNMMQRRIEMRRRNEERERHQQHTTGSQQQQEVVVDSHDHGNAAAATAHHQQNQESLGQPQHLNQRQSHQQPVSLQYTHSQQQQNNNRPILKNNVNQENHGNVNYQQQQQQQQSEGNSPQSQDELMGQQHSYNNQPQQQQHHNQQQLQLPPMQKIRQQYNPQHQHQPPTLQYYEQQQQQKPMVHHHPNQQQQGNRYSKPSHSHNIQSQQQQQPSPPEPPPPPSNNNPMTIPSPPMLQRRQQFASSIPAVYHHHANNNHNNHNYNPHHSGGGGGELSHQRVYHGQSGLDKSGIVRTPHGSSSSAVAHSQRGQLMNRLKSHDSPSDEWHTSGGGNSMSYGMVNTSNNQAYQYHQPQQQLNLQQQHQQHHRTTEQNVHNNTVGYTTDKVERAAQHHQNQQQQYQVMNDSTLKEVHPHRNRFAHVPPQQQQQPARKQQGPKSQQPSPNPNHQHQQQPNWNDINQQYHDMNRQIHYQRQMELKHEQQQQQQQAQMQTTSQTNPGAEQGEHNITSSKSPHRQPRMAAQSPVEHLGNRSENIQWKNNGGSVLPRRIPPSSSSGHQEMQQTGSSRGKQGMQQQQQMGLQHFPQPSVPQSDVYGTGADGEGSIVSVSEQARKFQAVQQQQQQQGRASGGRSHSTGRGGGRVSSVPMSQQSNNYHSNNADEEGTVETISVASLRKGWERQQQQQQKPRAKSAGRLERSTPDQHQHAPAPPTKASSEYLDHKEGSPFGVWEERANRLARVRRREQRREQRKNIEDRWNASSGGGMKRSGSLPPPEKRRIGDGVQQQKKNQQEQRQGMVDGYQSEGPTRQRTSAMRANRDRYPTDGYQSEGPPQRRREDQHYEGQEVYQSKSHEAANRGDQQVQQIQYDEEVDSAVITPRDARRRLWDTNERLRAVLPRNEGSIGDVRDRWPEHHEEEGNVVHQHQRHHHRGNNKTRYHHSQSPHSRISGFGSPSNYSGISAASSGRFKSKFVHAAAVAAQKRVEDASRQREYEEARLQEQRHHQQQQQRANEFVEEYQEDDLEEFNPDLMQVQHQQHHHHEQMSKSKHHHPHKDHAMNSSHYTDSTDETTKDLTTPGGSYGSSNVRRVSRSPPQRPMQPGATSSTMPSISEAAPAQVETHTSVAELITRINAVSRSNPAEALAAIDSIIKREGGIAGGSGNQVQQVEVARTPSNQDLFSPSRAAVVTPSPSERANTDGVVKHLGKEFFQERYEEVIHSTAQTGVVTKELHMGAAPGATAKELQRFNSELAVRGSMEMRGSHERDAAENDRRNEHDEEEDDDDDSLLSSSDDSTVSSMTNPTYQSVQPEQLQKWKRLQGQSSEHQPPPVQVTSRNKQARQQPDQKLQDKPQKSWNTLKQEYNSRRSPSPPIVRTAISKARSTSSQGVSTKKSSPAVQQDISETHTTSHDIGVDTYGPDDEIEFNPDDMDLVDNSPPNTIPKSNTDDFAPGFCGMSYNISASQSDTKKSGADAEPPRLKPSSSTATSAWTPFGTGTNSNDDKGRRREKTAKTVRPAVQAKPRTGNANWPFMGSPQPKQDTSRKEKSAKSRQGAKNKRASSSSQAICQSQASLHSGDTMPTRSATPESKNKEPKRASTPEIMMAVTDAFSNVDISLDGTSRNMVDVEPPLEQLDSHESKQSLHSISEAFSDVDVDLGQEKTVSQRRAELERLSKSWVMSKTFSNDSSGSSSFKVPPRKNDTVAEPPQAKNKASWANKPAQKASRFTIKKPKIPEPKLRLKGGLAQKFANLVDAFED